MKRQNVTLKDISKKLNVSTTTVANALNGNPNISDELRETIIKEADAMGYKPNITAKAMSRNGLRFALFMSEEPADFVGYLINGIYEMIDRYGDFKITLDEYLYHDNASTIEAYDCANRLIKQDYDGIIYGKSFESRNYVPILNNYVEAHPNTKIVYLNNDIIDDDDISYAANVSSNGVLIGETVSQIIGIMYPRGCNVGIISTSENCDNHKIIVDNFRNNLDKYNINLLDVLYNNDNKSGTYSCTCSLIDNHPELDLIYITSFDSVSVCRCIENRGLTDRIKVIGHDIYDDIIPYFKKGPLVSSIYQNQKKIGHTLIRVLFNSIMGITLAKRDILIRPEIIIASNAEEYLNELKSTDTDITL